MTRPKTCFGCVYLRSKADAAGGGTYYCGRLTRDAVPSGIVLGEWGMWAKPEIDDPKPLNDDCYERRRTR